MVGAVLKFTGDLPNIINSLLKIFDFEQKCIDIKYWESYGDNGTLDFNEFDNLSSIQIVNELINEEMKSILSLLRYLSEINHL